MESVIDVPNWVAVLMRCRSACAKNADLIIVSARGAPCSDEEETDRDDLA